MDELLPPPNPEEREQRLERERISRRTFLMNVGIGLNVVVALAIAAPVVAYVLGPVIKRRTYLAWVDVGTLNTFPEGETTLIQYKNPFNTMWDGATADIPAYVRADGGGRFTVFAINCAHLGCPVRWFSESQLFMCPCHGGVYYADGSRAAGPPERGLFTYPTKVENGRLLIDAGQMPTLSNQASNKPCSPLHDEPGNRGRDNKGHDNRIDKAQPALVTKIEPIRIEPWPGTKTPTIG